MNFRSVVARHRADTDQGSRTAPTKSDIKRRQENQVRLFLYQKHKGYLSSTNNQYFGTKRPVRREIELYHQIFS